MVDYIGVCDIQRIVASIGAARVHRAPGRTRSRPTTAAGRDFDKSARLASHSPVGVIELMPITDGAALLVQVRQRPPEATPPTGC